jgi:hypothetical protein
VSFRSLSAELLLGGNLGNDYTLSGQLMIGVTGGARVVVDGARTALLIYNSSDQLVQAVSPNSGTDSVGNFFDAGFWSFDEATGLSTQLFDGEVEWFIVGQTNAAGGIGYAVDAGGGAIATIISGNFVGQPTPQSALYLRSDDGGHPAVVLAQQEQSSDSGVIVGSVIQNDNDSTLTSEKFVHGGIYSPTFAAGVATFAHGCTFTPTRATITSCGAGTPIITQLSYTSPISGPNITVQAYTSTGGAYTGSSELSITFWG